MEAMQADLRSVLETKSGVVQTVTPSMTVSAAVELINSKKIGSVLVMDGERLVGIFTERDVLRRVVGERRNPDTTRVADVMTRELVVMRPTSTVADAMTVVSERRCRHLPVVDHGKVVGVVSAGDLNHWLIRNRNVDVERLVDYITGKYPA
jgi:CBS domain-containing protein